MAHSKTGVEYAISTPVLEQASGWRPPVPTALARLPGQWQADVTPAVLDDGSTGIAAHIDVHSW